MVYRTSTWERERLQEEALSAASPWSPKARHLGHAARHPPKARRHRSQLARLLAAALLVAFLTGCTSYRMHLAVRREQQEAEDGGRELGRGAQLGALAGLRGWFSGAPSRRSLREGVADGGAGMAGRREAVWTGHKDAGALSVQLYDQWWLLGGDGMLPPAVEPEGASLPGDGGPDTPVQRLLRLRRLQPTAVRVFDFKAAAWVPHNLTRFPQEVPVARWAVASLLNKAKRKESAIFLVGGYMSPAEAAAGRPPRSHRGGGGGGAAALARAGGAAAADDDDCPLASAGVYTVNPGRNKVRALPPLPAPCYGATAVVAGARLHAFGGWATPDRATRLAAPAAGHWSIGLNADGSSAPEWQQEEDVPAALLGRHLTALALSAEEEGEPAIYVWSGGGGGGSSIGSSEAACYGGGGGGGADGGGGAPRAVQLWSYAASSGWQRRGLLPQPLGDDVQCAVAATPHQLLAVGAVERSGLFSRQRGVWEYDARQGGRWTRAGWAPVEFSGHLCAIHHGRLFVSRALPPEPQAAAEEEEEEEGEGLDEGEWPEVEGAAALA